MQDRLPKVLTPTSEPGIKRAVLALTGNPGAGKTTVAEILRELGAQVISGDALGYALLRRDSPVYAQLIEAFGESICDGNGEIARSRLGQMVFSADHHRQRLNRIVHPLIKQAIREEIAEFRRSAQEGPLVVDAALIYEWGIEDWFDKVIVVSAPLDYRRRRFEALRPGATAHFDEREAAQIAQEEKERRADIVLYNDRDREYLHHQITNQLNLKG